MKFEEEIEECETEGVVWTVLGFSGAGVLEGVLHWCS